MIEHYINHLNINPYTFFGVNHADSAYRANKIWTREERRSLQVALNTAQIEIEKMLGYELKPTIHSLEPHPYTLQIFKTKFPFIIHLGKAVETDLPNETLSYAAEPATISLETDDPDSIHIYHPLTNTEIIPTERSYSDPILTLSIPRYLLLEDNNNPIEGWTYSDLDNYITEVQVKQITFDDTYALQSNKKLLLIDAEKGLLQIDPTDCPTTSKMYVNYQSGKQALDEHSRDILVGYTHTKMPIPPVEDQAIKLAWLWDRDIPQNMSTPQRECPLGQFTAAYKTFRYASLNRVHRTTPL